MVARRGLSRTGALIGAVLALALIAVVVITIRDYPSADKGSGLGEEFTYDLAPLRKTDPNLIHYEEAGGFPTGFKRSRGIAVGPKDWIYAAGDMSVRAFDPDGGRLWEISVSGPPQCLAVAHDGAVYVGAVDRIEVHYRKSGKSVLWESLEGPGRITSIAASPDAVFVADAANRVVVHYDRSGKLIGRIGTKDKAKGIDGFVVPSPYFDLAVDGNGLLWVVNPGRHRVESYAADGCRGLSWGRSGTGVEGFCGCCNPTHIAVLPGGGFVTSEKGLPRVKVHDADGHFESIVAGAEAFAQGIVGLDLAVDSKGRILVLDPIANRVRVFLKKQSDTSKGPQDG